MTTNTGTRLRAPERKRLFVYLAALAAPDPRERAKAALNAATLLARRGLSWPALIHADAESYDNPGDEPPEDWRADVMALLARPDIGPADRAFLHKLAGWRAPGADGLRRLRQLIARAS